MKTTVVPAQITTVEDKIAGNLNFTQLLLLISPVFLSALLFTFLPPFMQLNGLKLMISGIALIGCGLMAIRIRGEIMLDRLALLFRYHLRSHYVIYNKNDNSWRAELFDQDRQEIAIEQAKPVGPSKLVRKPSPSSSLVGLEAAIADPYSRVQFKVKKGGLYVFIKEIE